MNGKRVPQGLLLFCVLCASLNVFQHRKRRITFHQNVYPSGCGDFLSGTDALGALRAGARRVVNPLFNYADFEVFMKELVQRKLRSGDKEFVAKCEVRDMRRQHKGELEKVDRRFSLARNAYMESDVCARLEALDQSVRGGRQAVQSMRKFVESEVEDSDDEVIKKKRENCKLLLPDKICQLAKDEATRRQVRESSEEYRALESATTDREEVYVKLGLRGREKLCQQLSSGEGRGRNERGRSFENAAYSTLTELLKPKIVDKYLLNTRTLTCDDDEIFCLRNIKFGMASVKGGTAEFDSLVCRSVKGDRESLSGAGGSWNSNMKNGRVYVEVLAVVEVKRNPDDLGEAFSCYQPSLRWLCGLEEEYDPGDYRTKAYPRGHFDVDFYHTISGGNGEKARTLVFNRASFKYLRDMRVELSGKDGGSLFPSSLYFITRHSNLDCMSSKAMAWTLDKVGSCEALGPGARLVHSVKEGRDGGDEEEETDIDVRRAALENIRQLTLQRYPPKMTAMELLTFLEEHGSDQVVVI